MAILLILFCMSVIFTFFYFLPHGSENVFSAVSIRSNNTETMQKKITSNYMQNKINKIARAGIPLKVSQNLEIFA